MSTVFFVGPLPPPVHGFSVINEAFLKSLASACKVVSFDRAVGGVGPAGAFNRIRRLIKAQWLLASFFFRLCVERPTSVYLGMSGGHGQVLDLLFLALAKIFGCRIYVHHHNFNYLDNPTYISNWTMLFLISSNHIVLCHKMASLLSEKYMISTDRLHVLSNIAFVAPVQPFSLSDESSEHGVFRVGFLSNITEEKGVFDFIETVSELTSRGLHVLGTIAGPVDDAVSDRFFSAINGRSDISYVGPVYGGEKIKFFNRVDCLLFPTKYKNEAEPVTIIEAFRAGLPVVATERGCIREMGFIGHISVVEGGKGVSIRCADALAAIFNDFLFKDSRMDRVEEYVSVYYAELDKLAYLTKRIAE